MCMFLPLIWHELNSFIHITFCCFSAISIFSEQPILFSAMSSHAYCAFMFSLMFTIIQFHVLHQDLQFFNWKLLPSFFAINTTVVCLWLGSAFCIVIYKLYHLPGYCSHLASFWPLLISVQKSIELIKDLDLQLILCKAFLLCIVS